MTYFIKGEDKPTLKRGLAELWTENNEELSLLAQRLTRVSDCAQAGLLEGEQKSPEAAPNTT